MKIGSEPNHINTVPPGVFYDHGHGQILTGHPIRISIKTLKSVKRVLAPDTLMVRMPGHSPLFWLEGPADQVKSVCDEAFAAMEA